MKKTRVLFVVNENAHFTEFYKLLTVEPIMQDIQPLLLFDRFGYDLSKLFEREQRTCAQSNIQFHNMNIGESFDSVIAKIGQFLRRDRFRYLPGRKLLLGTLNFFLHYQKLVWELKIRIDEFQKFCRSQKIDVIVLGEENVLLDTFVYSFAVPDKKFFIYPYTIPNPLEMLGGAYRKFSQKSIDRYFYKFFFPKWVRCFTNDIASLLISPAKILALKRLGFSPINPWVLNADSKATIFVENKKMLNLYRSFAIPETRLCLVGSLNDDVLFKLRTNKATTWLNLQKKYSLNPNLPVILLALPPNQFPKNEALFRTYDEFLNYLALTLKEYTSQFTIVAVTHPRTRDDLSFLKSCGITLANESTSEWLAVAACYIASASATIRWALLIGIPVINFDFYRYYYGDYDSESMVRTVYDTDSFLTALGQTLKIVAAQTHAQQSNHTVPTINVDWGFWDGQVFKRIIALLKETS